ILIKTTSSFEDRDFSTLEEARETLEKTVDDFVLALLTRGEIHRDALGVDTKVRRVLDGSPHVGCFEELFGGYTTTVQARATYLVALDYRHTEPGGRAVEGGGVTSGSS